MAIEFEDILELGYGKPVCDFLDSVDLGNLSFTSKHSASVVDGHVKRWGMKKPIWRETHDGHTIVQLKDKEWIINFPIAHAHFQTSLEKGKLSKFFTTYEVRVFGELPPYDLDDTPYYDDDQDWQFFESKEEVLLLKRAYKDFQVRKAANFRARIKRELEEEERKKKRPFQVAITVPTNKLKRPSVSYASALRT